MADGHKVVVLDNLSSGHKDNLSNAWKRITFVEGDVRDAETCLNAAEGCDGIFHEAALVSVPDSINRPRDNHDINLTGTLNVSDSKPSPCATSTSSPASGSVVHVLRCHLHFFGTNRKKLANQHLWRRSTDPRFCECCRCRTSQLVSHEL